MGNDLKRAFQKAFIRERVFQNLLQFAYPDSRFHYDFGSFIADFRGSREAIKRLLEHRFYRQAQYIFITPDNCLEKLRYQALLDKKFVLTTTYSILRGFLLLNPKNITQDCLLHAATLDGMERYGKPLMLKQIMEDSKKIDFLVTGTSAINEEGIRLGKGHGFFDFEWGMLYRVGKVGTNTPSAAVVHDCQVLNEFLYPEEFDTASDVIFTPTRTIEVSNPNKPKCGIIWDLLHKDVFLKIPPLQELKEMEKNLPKFVYEKEDDF